MKTKRWISISAIGFVALALSGCPGVGGKIGPLSGKIVNYSGLPTEQFTLSYYLSCNKPTLRPSSCGSQGESVHPDANGNYTIPAIDAQSYEGMSYDLAVILTPPKNDLYPKEEQGKLWSASDENIPALASELSTITVFAFDPQTIQYNLVSGTSSESWASGEGRDADVSYTLDFSLGKDTSENHDATTVFSINGLVTDKSIEKLASHLIFVPGNYAVDAPVDLTAVVSDNELVSSGVVATLHEQTRYSSTFPAALRTFAIDDRGFQKEIRQLNGQWNVSMTFYERDSGVDLFNGTMNVLCKSGVITGNLVLDSAPSSENQWNGTIPVSGSCSKDTGEIHFALRYSKDFPDQDLMMTYDRIGGARAMLLQKGRDMNNPDAVFTPTLQISERNGVFVGKATIDKN